ncbi:hypothetical protein CGCSCA4_v008669 [Colletotrichum siamense]|uniref:Uncharacterized protein n=1 Tax=Colletotrichum siamense TaxID=690259 RepID=A0A9P5K460_COLSI|nr:hypothetical protein CGCSCA4_v008669 [Colletotrichum siamense]KAF4858438.1 hypothetical protein CGCSCA2_v007250 [Colletotrichum siamense]
MKHTASRLWNVSEAVACRGFVVLRIDRMTYPEGGGPNVAPVRPGAVVVWAALRQCTGQGGSSVSGFLVSMLSDDGLLPAMFFSQSSHHRQQDP